LAPWWSRPTAEGAREKSDDTKAAAEASSLADAARVAAAEAQESEEAEEEDGGGADERPSERRGRRRGRSGSASPLPDDPTPSMPPATPQRQEEEQHDEPKRTDGRRGRTGGGRAAPAPEPEREPPRRPPARPKRGGDEREPADRGRMRPGETVTVAVPREEEKPREIVITMPERGAMFEVERRLGVFCDLENVALGARDSGIQFDINLVLERLVEKGKIIVKRAYCDWTRYNEYKRAFHEAGIELIDIPQKRISGKNSADIKMVVDAMDMSYSKEHLNTFVLVSGDSDFSPLVSKLKENNKHVIGVGVKNSSSNLLIDNCDEFIYYEDIWRDVESAPKVDNLPDKEQEVFGLLVDAIVALQRENKDVLWGSMIKQTMQRKRPSFNEGYYGYSTFSELLEDAEAKKIVNIKKDQRSGSYVVTGFSGGRPRGRRR